MVCNWTTISPITLSLSKYYNANHLIKSLMMQVPEVSSNFPWQKSWNMGVIYRLKL